MMPSVNIIEGDSLTRLKEMPSDSVQCCVTSPPYWGLRDYGVEGQMGSEETPEQFVSDMVAVFEEVRRVLKPDGTCWVNMGDSYAGSWGSQGRKHSTVSISQQHARQATASLRKSSGIGSVKHLNGLKPKDLCGMPWRLAFALQSAGWFLRADIIWHKPNPMPESVTDRTTKSHEYIFLLAKKAKYFYDIEAIREPASWNTHARRSRAVMGQKSNPDSLKNGIRPQKAPDGWDTSKGNGGHGSIHRKGRSKGKIAEPGKGIKSNTSYEEALCNLVDTRNKRSVWTICTDPYKEAHFATFPPDLIKPCILAGTRPGDVVLDPFGGSGTTGMVALELGRNALLIELNPAYAEMARRRCNITPGLNL